MTRLDAYRKLREITTERENVEVYDCDDCGCVTLSYDEGFTIYMDRYTFNQDGPHECDCHEVSKDNYEEGETND